MFSTQLRLRSCLIHRCCDVHAPGRCGWPRARMTGVQSVETRSSWIVATVVLVILAVSFGAPWITVVALKAIASETGGLRAVPALSSALAWIGYGLGGIVMGQIAEKVGVRWTVTFGAVMVCVGLALSSRGETWQLYVGQGLFMGFLGIGGMNAPFYIYVSRWFDRRRGSALALISSGAYLAGAVWPPVFERAIAYFGWRQTMLYYGFMEIALVVPLALIFLQSPPEEMPHLVGGSAGSRTARTVMGWPPNLVYALIAIGIVLCCLPMAVPQAHLPAFCSDLGISPSHGAAMLSVLLGAGFLSRQFWGWVSDFLGGLETVLIGSAFQLIAMVLFLLITDEVGLFAVSLFFGLGFAGLIPANVLAVRQLFPAEEASWRIPTLLLASGTGMASGGWLGGVLYDHFGYYAPAFLVGVLANVANLLLVVILVWRQKWFTPRLALS
jgi:MFS family permease